MTVTYANTSNVTGFDSAFDYSAVAIQQSVGYDAFGPMIMVLVFLGFYTVGSKYTQERAFFFASFMATIVSFLMVSGHYMDPMWMLLPLFALIGSVFFLNRVS
jgi:hypothetical protein